MTPRLASRTKRSFLLFVSLLLASAELGAQGTLRSKLSQHGISWTFDKAYSTGQFATGDWWVVGPVKIVQIDPRSVSGSRVMNGSMINPPAAGVEQGYDSRMRDTRYVANVAVNVSSSRPLTVPVNSSLLSSRSHPTASRRPQLLDIAILTVLPKAAPSGAFRPPYCGTNKTVRFNKNQLNYSILRSVTKTRQTPSLASVERLFERPWIDHIELWMISSFAPSNNMKSYGRDLAADVGLGALSLNLNYTNSQKEKLFIRMVQLGIDNQGVLDSGGNKNWRSGGGYGHGRKFPILLAGMALTDAHMKNVGWQKDVWFGEDQSTFYVAETSPGVFNYGHGGYKSSHKGMPEWGSRHRWQPQGDNVNWGANSYRQCCTANSWVGFVLAAHMMGMKKLWNHDALFDYQDRYITYQRKINQKSWMISWFPWPLEMWDKYRNSSPPNNNFAASFKTKTSSAFINPAGVHIKQVVPKEVRLDWTNSPNNSHSYRVYRGATTSSLKLLKDGVTDTTFTDPSVAGGSTLIYAIAAVDKSGRELGRIVVTVRT